MKRNLIGTEVYTPAGTTAVVSGPMPVFGTAATAAALVLDGAGAGAFRRRLWTRKRRSFFDLVL